MNKLATWIVLHAAHWAVLYGAFVIDLEGAMYVLKFFIWSMVFVAPLLLTGKAQENAAKMSPTPVRVAMIRIQYWVTLLVLVWFGHIATAVAWCWVMVCVAIYRASVKKMCAERIAAVA